MPFNPNGPKGSKRPVINSINTPSLGVRVSQEDNKKHEKKKRKQTRPKPKKLAEQLPFTKGEVEAVFRVVNQWLKIRSNRRIKDRKNSSEVLMGELARSFLEKLEKIYEEK